MQEFFVRCFNLSTLRQLGFMLGLAGILTGAPAIQPANLALAAPQNNSLSFPASSTAPLRTGVVVPLYSYPGPEWDRLVQVKSSYPRVPIVAVINPNNGPGGAQDPNYVSGVQNLHSVGITVLGYVYTSYATRATNTVAAEVNMYWTWYELDGIFFDQMSDVAGYESYYSNLNNYAKALGFQFTMGNPATGTLPSYIGTVDNLNIYENTGLPSLALLDGWHESYSKYNFSMLVHGVDSLDTDFVTNASGYVGYLYFTDDDMPNPYDVLPRYFEQLVAALDNLAPVANNAYTVNGHTTLSVAAPGVLAHDYDPDGDPLLAVLVTGPAHGTLTLNTDGSFTYVPEPNLDSFVDSFSYAAFDGKAYSTMSTVTIQVNAP